MRHPVAHGHESVVGDGMYASLIVLGRHSIFETCRTVRVIPRYARFSYESALKSYESARAQAFEQYVVDVKETSVVRRAISTPPPPPPRVWASPVPPNCGPRHA